jgi:acetylornithine/succinyldiaminopimelate/putrescine aminotransferase
MKNAWTLTEANQTNQIDLIAKGLGNGSFIAGYDSMDRLLEFVDASLHGGGNANLIVAMTIATCKNLIDEQLQGEQQ